MAIGADRTGKPPLRCLFLLQSSPTLLPGQWDCHQSCKYTLGATFVIISQNFLIARHKSFGCATIARHNIKHALWRAIAVCVAFYLWPGLYNWSNYISILTAIKGEIILINSLHLKFRSANCLSISRPLKQLSLKIQLHFLFR